MKQTTFRFFKNTPFIDFQNTVHFKSNADRDYFFLNSNMYEEIELGGYDFNFIRDRSSIVLPIPYDEMLGVNYCTFKSDFEDVRYYAYVINYEFLNPNSIRVNLLVDGIMTYTQGNVLEQLPNLDIQRQHLTSDNYNKSLWELKNNDDIIKTHSKSYFHTDRIIFDELLVVITSSADLKGDFGNVDDPKIKTSYGKIFDKITSPLNLYACDIEQFNYLMVNLGDYPWISQNLTSLSLIPRIFMEDNLTLINFSSEDSLHMVDYLYEVTGLYTRKSSIASELNTISYDMEQAYELFDLDPEQDKHLLRNEYTTTELYNYSGGQLFVDNGQLNKERGLSYEVELMAGYHNEIKIFIEHYRVENRLMHRGGAYLNDSLVFNEFDDIPMLIDTPTLAMAKGANVRALAESKLITNRVSNVLDPHSDIKDRFFDATSILTSFSPLNLFGKFQDEHEYYRTLKAEEADLALETPSITQQTTGNSFNIANDAFGIHIKYSKPSKNEMDKIRKYYKMFGFQVNDHNNKLDKVDSMSICNYVQFTGSWTIPNADVSIVEMMKAQFENGVRLWTSNNTPNPMERDVLRNKIIK